MKVKTSQLFINDDIKESIVTNWKSDQNIIHNNKILDNMNLNSNSNFNITLRIPWQYKGSTNHILIKGNIEFTKIDNKIALSIICNIIKPLVLFTFLGFLSSFVFLMPLYLLSQVNLIIPILTGVVLSAFYFGFFYLRMQMISSQFIYDLKNKYSKLTSIFFIWLLNNYVIFLIVFLLKSTMFNFLISK